MKHLLYSLLLKWWQEDKITAQEFKKLHKIIEDECRETKVSRQEDA